MARLPQDGESNWGQVLNEYLLVSHNADGTLRQVSDRQLELYPEDFGAKMDDPNAATINDDVIDRLIKSLPDEGGVMVVTGALYVSIPIHYPLRAFPDVDASGTARSLNFTIRGNSASSKIIQTTANPAIAIETVNAIQYQPPVSKAILKDITIISAGDGVRVTAGGKSVVLSNVIIGSCQGTYGLLLKNFYGGVLDRIYCFKNANVGIRLEDCNMVNLHGLTTRENAGNGIEIANCVSLSGYLYSESNGGWALDAHLLRESTFNVWFEASRGMKGLDKVQARLRSSFHNRFLGRTGVTRHVGFDADPISRTRNIVEGEGGLFGDLYHSKFACDYFGMIDTEITQLLFNNSFSVPHIYRRNEWAIDNLDVVMDDTVGYSDNASLRVTIKAGAYSNLPDNASSSWLDLFRWGGGDSPLAQLNYDADDWFIIRFRAKTDEQGAEFYKNQIETNRGYALRIASGSGLLRGDKQATLTSTEWHTIEWITQSKAAGGGLGLFFYFGSHITSGPDTAHNIWIDDVEIYHIPNSNSVHYFPASPPILINDDDNGYPQDAKTPRRFNLACISLHLNWKFAQTSQNRLFFKRRKSYTTARFRMKL